MNANTQNKTAAKPAPAKPAAKAAPAAAKPASPNLKFAPGSMIAVVRIRGVTGMNPKRQHTLELLGIHKSHYATIVPANPIYLGMLRQAKDYISWGSVSEPVVVSLLTKRGCDLEGHKLTLSKKPAEIAAMAKELMGGKTLKALGIERTFRLTPPSGGFKNRKKNYPYGDLGVRSSMDDALKAMI